MKLINFTSPKLTIFSDIFNRNSIGNDYTQSGISFTCEPGLKLVSGNNGFTNYLSRNYTTGFENWTNIIDFKINTIGYGLGFTIKSPILDFTIKLCCDSTDSGKIKIYGYGTNLHTTSIIAATLNTTDIFRFKIIRIKDIFNIYIEKKVVNYYEQIFNYVYISNILVSSAVSSLPKIGKPTITNFGGEMIVYNWEFIANEWKDAMLAILGDSITQCYYSTSMSKRWVDITPTAFRRVVLGCGGDTTELLNTRLSDLDFINPKNVLIFIGANETSTSTFNTNYRLIIEALILKGYRIILTSCIPKNSSDRRPYNTVISNICTDYSLQYINIYTPLVGSGYALNSAYDSGDGIHPNNAGHLIISGIIATTIVLKIN